jgi:hypothetical protein
MEVTNIYPFSGFLAKAQNRVGAWEVLQGGKKGELSSRPVNRPKFCVALWVIQVGGGGAKVTPPVFANRLASCFRGRHFTSLLNYHNLVQ